MKVKESMAEYNANERIKIGKCEFDPRLPQDLIDELMIGIKAIEEGRYMEHSEAMKQILKNTGLDKLKGNH